MKKKILFICTHNSARSQMAEGLTNHFFGERWDAYSAGTEKTSVKPMAVRVMAEAGIDISGHRSKLSTEFAGKEFDAVVTVCDSAKEACPFFPGAKQYVHRGFHDPSDTRGAGAAQLEAFRKSRDEILTWLREFLRS
jgi:arsenate reductase